MFKVGDKVQRIPSHRNGWWGFGDKVLTVSDVKTPNTPSKPTLITLHGAAQPGLTDENSEWDAENFRRVESCAHCNQPIVKGV